MDATDEHTRPPARRPPTDEALDLVDVPGSATPTRVLPVLAAALLVLLVVWRRRR